MDNSARDAKIVERYKAGENQEQLAKAYRLTRTRIQQVLSKAGVSYKDSPHAPQGDRYAFIGANVTKANKAKLKHEAKRTGKSMSRVIEEALEVRFSASK